MSSAYSIVKASPENIPVLPGIEAAAAAKLLKGYIPESILNEVTDENDLYLAQQEGRLWVALTEDKKEAGFAMVEIFNSDHVHLVEMDVHPDQGRKGIGRSMVSAICQWAAESHYSQVTLTTFCDLPWNAPFYASLGFQVVPTEELTPELLQILRDEAKRGLDGDRRVAMRYRCTVSIP
ncbi:hypothetical protein EC973_006551 [Apophysomyces ossiformis]|uniref:N-acetyltransferase domain-containing protein n=1 Tax=Apophysomyces ossiformis TaxID=679940 RepID=A0A8H7BQH4_9FUNG|nr:hypothetical protein EC973_006551 [Apophysomyces ossiformis]